MAPSAGLVKAFNLAPAMASVHTTLVKNDASRALFEIAKGDTPLPSIRALPTAATASRLSSLTPSTTLKAMRKSPSAAVSSSSTPTATAKHQPEGRAGSGQIDALNEYNQKVQLRFVNLTTDGATELASFNERIGQQKMTLDKLAISVEGKELALIDGMALDGGSTLTQDGKGVNSQVNYTVNSLKLQGQDMGSGKLTLKVDNVDGQAWHQFSQQYSAQSQALLAKPELAQNPELYQQALTETLFNALPILLKGNPSVTISPLSWRNAKGESTLNLSVLLKDPAQVTAPPQTLADSLDRVVQSLDGKVVIPVDMATEFMTKIAGLEGYQPADAAKLADQQVKGLAAMGQMFRITTMEDNAISSSLQYANGQVTLNGQKMPLQDFAAMFGLEAPSLPDSAPQEGQPQQDDAAPQQDDAAPQP